MKLTAAMLAAALCSILMWACHQFGGLTVPPEVASSFTTLFTFLVHAFVPESDLDESPAAKALQPLPTLQASAMTAWSSSETNPQPIQETTK